MTYKILQYKILFGSFNFIQRMSSNKRFWGKIKDILFEFSALLAVKRKRIPSIRRTWPAVFLLRKYVLIIITCQVRSNCQCEIHFYLSSGSQCSVSKSALLTWSAILRHADAFWCYWKPNSFLKPQVNCRPPVDPCRWVRLKRTAAAKSQNIETNSFGSTIFKD